VLGRVEGPLTCEDGVVVVAHEGTVAGDIIAHDITVHGESDGQLVATDIVDVRHDGVASGTVIARRFFLEDGGVFQGRVEPQMLEAALRVARFNRQRRDADD